MKKLKIFFVLLVVLFLADVESVYAFCSEPSMYKNTPDAPYQKPRPPYCLSGYKFTGEHDCDAWEIDSYINKVNGYIRDLDNYIDEANSFAEEAISFANDVTDYANCEAKEAKSALQ